MPCIFCIPFQWFTKTPWVAKKLDLPSSADLDRYFRDWEDAQTNDWEILQQDPAKEDVQGVLATLSEDREARFKALLALAESGSAWSMVHVGWCYFEGDGVDAQPERGWEWSQRAADAGSQRAQLDVGRRCWARDDLDQCEAIFGKSAEAGWPPALYWVARCRLERTKTGETFRQVRPSLEAAVADGSPAAKALLGRCLARGWGGLRDISLGSRLLMECGSWAVAMQKADRVSPREVAR